MNIYNSIIYCTFKYVNFKHTFQSEYVSIVTWVDVKRKNTFISDKKYDYFCKYVFMILVIWFVFLLWHGHLAIKSTLLACLFILLVVRTNTLIRRYSHLICIIITLVLYLFLLNHFIKLVVVCLINIDTYKCNSLLHFF